MKKLFLLSALIICAFSLSAKEIIVENPPFSVASQSHVIIRKVVITDTETLLHMTVLHSPNNWIRISSDTYIRTNKQKYIVQSAEGIQLDKEVYSDKSGKTQFVLKFAPISPDTKQIDFIESDCDDCFKIWGIELKPGVSTKSAEVPLKVKKEAQIKEDGKSLEIPPLKSGKAIVKGQLLSYIPEMNWKIKMYVDNPVTGIQEELEATIKDDGNFELEVPLVCSMQVLFRTPICNDYILLSPGKTTTICIDLHQKSLQETKNEALKRSPSKFMYFGGANAEINNQLYDMGMQSYLRKFLYSDQMSSDILGMTADQYKSYILKRMNEAIEGLSQKGLTKKAYEFAVMSIRFNTANKLMFGNNDLANAYRKAHKLSYRDKLTGYVQPEFDQDYYSFLKDFNINRSLSLYYNLLGNVVNSCKYILRKETRINYISRDMWQRLIDSGKLSPEEIEAANFQKKMALDNWDESKLKIFKEREIQFGQELIHSGKLDDKCSQLTNQLLELCNDRASIAVPILEKRSLLIMALMENKIFKQEEFDEMLKKLNQPIPDKDETTDPEVRKEQYIKLYEKHSDLISKMREEKEVEDKKNLLAQIFGTSEGLVFDLMETQGLCRKFEEHTPLTTEDLEKISRMKDPFYLNYLTEKNNELLAQIEKNKNKKGYNVYDAPETKEESLFSDIIKPFEGKVILVDFWATWCGPCRSAMKEFEATKNQLKEKGVVFVYLTDETSPLNTWNNMIPNISGEHYRLKNAQFQELKKKFGVNGVPSYLILNKKGDQVYFKVGFEGSNTLAGLLNTELEKN